MNLLIKQPQFADHCTWKFADYDSDESLGKEWTELLIVHPQFAEHCPWAALDGWACSSLLKERPEFADRCNWSRMEPFGYEPVIWRHPDLFKYIKSDDISKGAWAAVIKHDPAMLVECRKRRKFQSFASSDWKSVVMKHPALLSEPESSALGGWCWCDLLQSIPNATDYCVWSELSGRDWVDLIKGLRK